MKENWQVFAGTTAGTQDGPEDALRYLQSVYRNPLEPTSTRMRAAGLALPHEVPKFGVIAHVIGDDFQERLDRCIERSAKVIEHQPQVDRRRYSGNQGEADGQ